MIERAIPILIGDLGEIAGLGLHRLEELRFQCRYRFGLERRPRDDARHQADELRQTARRSFDGDRRRIPGDVRVNGRFQRCESLPQCRPAQVFGSQPDRARRQRCRARFPRPIEHRPAFDHEAHDGLGGLGALHEDDLKAVEERIVVGVREGRSLRLLPRR